MKKNVESLRNEQIKIAKKAYNNNKDNFEFELKRLFKDNEYITDDDSIVKVRSYIDDDGDSYFQFHIEVIGELFDTEFYRYDYCEEKQNTIDEFDLYEIVGAEVVEFETYTIKDIWFYSN